MSFFYGCPICIDVVLGITEAVLKQQLAEEDDKADDEGCHTHTLLLLS